MNLYRGDASSINKRLLSGTFWVSGSFVVSQAVRLASNLVLTRLLFPEAFGLMALVNLLIQGLHMISDLGINASIVYSRRGEEREYLNTAFCLQVLRGVGLCAMTLLLAAPLGLFYEKRQLTVLAAAVAVTPLIGGFTPTKFHRLTRTVQLFRPAAIKLCSQLVSVLLMIAVAYLWRSVWALVIGAIAGACLQLLLSHVWIPGKVDHFRIDWNAAREIIRFGRWISISTALTFLANQGDRLVLGKSMTMEELGVYSVAFFIAMSVQETLRSISSQVLFPLFSELVRNKVALSEHIARLRIKLLLGALPLICILISYGDAIVHFLYDDRYREAGWMLRVLSVGGLMGTLIATVSPVLLAHGDSRRALCMVLGLTVSLFGSMIVGWQLAGNVGIVVGVAASKYIFYPFFAALIRRYGVGNFRLDAVALLGSAALAVLLCSLRPFILPLFGV